ncbi:hypothetical protein H5410_022241 [Solanum commersonii]|uniref:Uncharacterized protein n=1 Tax=Solanum commersonii TaxID=4109 RepID=A0A9J5ZGL4_SOLCO|nr:hypothetical protein H5410_022241 [Solanum commersonii]
MIFIDFDKNYNKVLSKRLEARGILVAYIRAMKGYHFLVEKELQKGSTLNMFLFALLINELTQYIHDKVHGLKHNSWSANSVLHCWRQNKVKHDTQAISKRDSFK